MLAFVGSTRLTIKHIFSHLNGEKDLDLSIASIAMIVILVIDISIGNLSAIMKLGSGSYIMTFAILVVTFALSSLVILESVKYHNIAIIEKAKHVNFLTKILTIVQYILIAILGIAATQTAIYAGYNTIILTIGSTIAYAMSVIVMSVLSLLLFSWFKINKSLPVFLYGLSALSIVSAIILIAALTDFMLPTYSSQRNSLSNINLFIGESNPSGANLQYLAATYNSVAFIVLWISTIFLLNYYSRRIGKIKFWFIMSLPIIAFLIQFIVVTPLMAAMNSPNIDQQLVTVFWKRYACNCFRNCI